MKKTIFIVNMILGICFSFIGCTNAREKSQDTRSKTQINTIEKNTENNKVVVVEEKTIGGYEVVRRFFGIGTKKFAQDERVRMQVNNLLEVLKNNQSFQTVLKSEGDILSKYNKIVALTGGNITGVNRARYPLIYDKAGVIVDYHAVVTERLFCGQKQEAEYYFPTQTEVIVTKTSPYENTYEGKVEYVGSRMGSLDALISSFGARVFLGENERIFWHNSTNITKSDFQDGFVVGINGNPDIAVTEDEINMGMSNGLEHISPDSAQAAPGNDKKKESDLQGD